MPNRGRPLKDVKFRCAQCGNRRTDAVVMGKGVARIYGIDQASDHNAVSRNIHKANP
jgi:hypothetical protein